MPKDEQENQDFTKVSLAVVFGQLAAVQLKCTLTPSNDEHMEQGQLALAFGGHLLASYRCIRYFTELHRRACKTLLFGEDFASWCTPLPFVSVWRRALRRFRLADTSGQKQNDCPRAKFSLSSML